MDRPAKVKQIVDALRSRHGQTVGITTAVHGAGGFGKTTVARLVRADLRVLGRFHGRVYWVTLGRDAGKQVLARLVNGLIAQLAPDREVTFTEVGQAAAAGQLDAVPEKPADRMLAVDFAPDGTWLATGSADGTVRTWDAATWQHRATLTHVGRATAVAIAPDGIRVREGRSPGRDHGRRSDQ